MKCADCGKDFLNSKKLVFHLEYFHKKKNYFVCPYGNCSRLYHRRSDFQKHVDTKHSDKKQQKKIEIKNQAIKDIFTCPKTTNVVPTSPTCHSNTVTEERLLDRLKSKFKTFTQTFEQSLLILISNLYDNLTLTRNAIQNIITGIQSFLSSGIVTCISECFNICLEVFDANASEISDINSIFKSMFEMLQNPFPLLDTDFKRLKVIEASQLFLKPVEHIIGVSSEAQKKNGRVSMVLKSAIAYYIPLSKTLKIFFETPGVFNLIYGYQESLLKDYKYENDTPMRNIVHGRLWQNIQQSSKHKIIFPLLIYFDDFEVGNPLGSHAGCYKIGAVYVTVGTVPPEFASRLENIFLALIFYSSDRVKYGNEATFNILINEIQKLEKDGLEIFVQDQNKKVSVYFSLVSVTGDNLGLHSIFGCTESFSSNNFCRFCITSKEETQNQICENVNFIRLKHQYNDHLKNKVGIKEVSVWHKLENFHIYENLVCDLMHDINEGVHRYEMALIIEYFIKNNFFSINVLNERIKYFTYDISEKNIPPGINKDHLKKQCLIMSSEEMACLVNNFRFLVSDLIPPENQVWQFYLKLLDISHFLIRRSLSLNDVYSLKLLITEHHEMYINLFETNLKPKHHHLIHYHRIIEKIGPPVYLSCERKEAKHKEFKTYCHNVRSRKNLPYSLALRIQQKSCFRFISKRGLNNIVNFGVLQENFSNIDLSLFSTRVSNISDYCLTSWYEFNGTKYTDNAVLIYLVANGVPKLCQMKYIFINKANYEDVYFECSVIPVLEFIDHIRAYKVFYEDNPKRTLCLKLSELYSKFPTILRRIGGDYFVSLNKAKI